MFNSNTEIVEGSSKNNNIKSDCAAYYVALQGFDDDATVAALPDTWVPKRSGPILADYLKKRKQDHNNILKEIGDAAKIINDRIESKIRALAEALLAHIQFNNNQMNEIVQKYNIEGTVLKKELRDQALKEIYQLYSERVDEMAHFNREASVIERERSEDLKIVLRDQFQRLIKVGHLIPKDLLHDFDERVYQINQQLLSNSRAYVDLEAQLRVQADENLARVRSAINQLCLETSKSDRAQSAVQRNFDEQRFHVQRPASAIREKKSETLVFSVGSTVSEVDPIDACIGRLVQAYKAAVLHVYNKFSDRLLDLENNLGAVNNITCFDNKSGETVEFREMIGITVRRLTHSVYNKLMASREMVETAGADKLAIQNSLWSLGECLQNTFKVLYDAGHLWDNHILRQALAQKLTIAAVEDLLTNNDAVEMSNEVSYNIALEHLRETSDLDKLQVECRNVMNMLERTAQMYRNHSEAELGRLEQYMNLPASLATILQSEFQCFLDQNPRSSRSPFPLTTASHNQNENLSLNTKPKALSIAPPNLDENVSLNTPSAALPLPRAILQTELQEQALRNWRDGFLESFECNVSLVPEELRRQARFWVEERANVLHMRYALKMVSHSVRVERVKAAFEMRQNELRHHETRLAAHLDTLNQIIDNLPNDASNFPFSETFLYPLVYWVSSIQKNIEALMQTEAPPDPETKRLKMSSYAPRLSKHRQLYEESIITAIDEFRKTVENQIQNARVANVRMMAHLTLFSEGGDYSALEAAAASNALIKKAELLEGCLDRVTEVLHARRTQLLSEADELLRPLQLICGESGRHANNKTAKTPQTKNKKK